MPRIAIGSAEGRGSARGASARGERSGREDRDLRSELRAQVFDEAALVGNREQGSMHREFLLAHARDVRRFSSSVKTCGIDVVLAEFLAERRAIESKQLRGARLIAVAVAQRCAQ